MFKFGSVTGSLLFSVLSIVSIAGTNACNTKAKVGDTCQAATYACQDPANELICQDGKFVAGACRGPGGCKEGSDKITCDTAGNLATDTCPKAEEGNGDCSADKKALTACTGGKYVTTKCTGPKGCVDTGTKVDCDIAAEAAPAGSPAE